MIEIIHPCGGNNDNDIGSVTSTPLLQTAMVSGQQVSTCEPQDLGDDIGTQHTCM
eukprot:m.40938 g.40938  ORF g.40938 m.40938 type:complete len:55 (-) comp14882_c0_seq1:1373-1537(-)